MNSLATIRKLVTVEELAALQHLELTAARVVEGFLTGSHRSKMKGGSGEFAEHRAYSAGDEVRRLDWRVVAKSDRYYIKQFHEEANLGVVLVLDASGSMAYGDSTRSKFLHARAAAACLGRLILGQRDPVGFAVAQRKASNFLPARSSAGHLNGLLEALLNTEAKGRNDLLSTLDWLIRNLRRRSQFVLLTDGFVELDILERQLLALAARGHQLLLLHVLAPEELTFSFQDNARFQCLETFQEVDVDPILMADTYLSRMQAFVDRLRRVCIRAGGDYEPLRTDQPLGTVLGDYLRRRMRRSRRYGAPQMH